MRIALWIFDLRLCLLPFFPSPSDLRLLHDCPRLFLGFIVLDSKLWYGQPTMEGKRLCEMSVSEESLHRSRLMSDSLLNMVTLYSLILLHIPLKNRWFKSDCLVWILSSEFWKPYVIGIAAPSSCSVCCLHSQYFCYFSTTSTPLLCLRELVIVIRALDLIAAAYVITSSFFIFFLLLEFSLHSNYYFCYNIESSDLGLFETNNQRNCSVSMAERF